MKKKIFTAIIALTIITPLAAAEPETLWGISKTGLINKFKIENYSMFKPSEKPEYNNRIIDFFNSMSSENRFDIFILRAGIKPETDYCFFNEKLYSVSEDWGDIETAKAEEILNNLKCRYAGATAEKKDQYTVYSFKKERTKVVLYKKCNIDKFVNVKIYYYSTVLFNMLLVQ